MGSLNVLHYKALPGIGTIGTDQDCVVMVKYYQSLKYAHLLCQKNPVKFQSDVLLTLPEVCLKQSEYIIRDSALV